MIIKLTSNIFVLVDHQQFGNELFRYNCSNCPRIYISLESLAFHQKVECYKEPKFACTMCHYKSQKRSNLRRHILTIHDKKPSRTHKSVSKKM